MGKPNKIYVTQPSLPSLEEFLPYLQQIWDNKLLTNNGPFHRQLEEELAKFLKVPYVSLFANGTLALISALHVLNIKGEVITTPYTFVATAHSLMWNNITPVFVDIEQEFCNLDPNKIEAAITPLTAAILPVHVYGNPCKVHEIKRIADKHNLRIIYDAAHSFGVEYNNESILQFGDLSILSFHATKAFNTMEGGAIICHDAATKKEIDFLKNFGFAGETQVVSVGINAKMNEFQAALGLLQLKYHKTNISRRKEIFETYSNGLSHCRGISLISPPEFVASNYSYFPLFIDENSFGLSRDQLHEKLIENNIIGRRYFYPLISQYDVYKKLDSSIEENLPIATKLAEQVLCLPIYPTLSKEKASYIIDLIIEANEK